MLFGSRESESFHFPISSVTIFRSSHTAVRLRLKCNGTCAENRFRLSAKRTSPFKSPGALVQSTGSRGVSISGSNAGYTMFRGSAKGTGYPLHSLVSLSLPLPFVTVCHHISTGVYQICATGGHVLLLPASNAVSSSCFVFDNFRIKIAVG